MTSLMENIRTKEENDDDSDAPVEMTTKISKVENKTTERKKKKKKSKTQRQLKYTLATDEDHDIDQKRLDEESALTHLVFGDDDDYVEEITAVAKSTKSNHQVKKENEILSSSTDLITPVVTAMTSQPTKKPAWIDSEEVTEEL